jgi:hypothetical protein
MQTNYIRDFVKVILRDFFRHLFLRRYWLGRNTETIQPVLLNNYPKPKQTIRICNHEYIYRMNFSVTIITQPMTSGDVGSFLVI